MNLFVRDIVAQRLPIARHWKEIDTLTTKQLERIVLHVLRLEYRVSHYYSPIPHPFHQRRSVTWVKLIQSQWLVVASSDDLISVISLWSVTSLLSSRSSPPTPLTEAFLPAPVITGAIDVDGSCVAIALELSGRLGTLRFRGFSLIIG